MNVIDRRDLSFTKGDVIVTDTGKSYLVIYENTCIGWYFLDLETMSFNEEICVETERELKVGYSLGELGKVVSVIKKDNLYLSIQ